MQGVRYFLAVCTSLCCVMILLQYGDFFPERIPSENMPHFLRNSAHEPHVRRPIGYMEYKQLQKYRNDKPLYDNATRKIWDFSYKVHVASAKSWPLGLYRLNIDEQYQNGSSLGGSSFRTELQHDGWLELCPYEDDFQGTYSVFCPRYAQCSQIRVHLMFVNFDAYRGLQLAPASKLIYEVQICSADRNATNASSASHAPPRDASAPTRLGVGRWRKATNNEWHWYERGVRLEPWSNYSIARCVNETMDSLGFLGSSHMRYLGDYILHSRGQMPSDYGRYHPSYHIGKQYFYKRVYADRRYGVEIKDSLKAELTRMSRDMAPKSTRDVLIISTGAWDACWQPLDTLAAFHNLSLAITTFVKESVWQNGTVILFTTMPYPDNDGVVGYAHRRSRNNFLLSALTYYQDLLLKDVPVKVFDAFRMFLPVNMVGPVCLNHYFCFEDERHIFVGQQGFPMVWTLMGELCPT